MALHALRIPATSLTQAIAVQATLERPIRNFRFNELFSGVRSDVAVKVFGDDMDVMNRTANQIAKVLNGVVGVADLKVERTTGLSTLAANIQCASGGRQREPAGGGAGCRSGHQRQANVKCCDAAKIVPPSRRAENPVTRPGRIGLPNSRYRFPKIRHRWQQWRIGWLQRKANNVTPCASRYRSQCSASSKR